MNLEHSSEFELIENQSIFSLNDLYVLVSNAIPVLSSQSSVFVNGASAQAILSGIIASHQHRCSVYLVRDLLSLPNEIKGLGANFLVRNDDFMQEHQGAIWLQSSGTTGRPKWLPHLLDRLCAAITPGGKRSTWLLCFEPSSFAGLQVILSALLGGHRLVCPAPNATPSELVQLVADNSITHMSATPTFWRSFLRASGNTQLPLKQITLGGEVVDQSTLDALGRRFVGAAIRHIYATTEMGVVMTIQDGKSGFPCSWLGSTLPSGMKLSLSERQTLLVTGPRVSLNHNLGPWDTSDVVSVVEDRAYFKGRADTLINVGGQKVFPEEVESYLLQLECISDVVVAAQSNPITGSILTADIVPIADVEMTLLKKQIEEHLKVLPRYARPALLRFKDHLTQIRTGKKSRLK